MHDARSPAPRWETRATRRLRRRSTLTLKRGLLLGAGLSLVLLGLATVPTPVPIGAVLIVVGLTFLAKGSRFVLRAVKWARRRSPRLSDGLNRLKPRLPKGIARFVDKSAPGA